MQRSPGLLVLLGLTFAACAQGSREPEGSDAGRYFFFIGRSDRAISAAVQGLWITDGTEAGTVRLRAFEGPAPERVKAADNRVYFAGPAYARELWTSDGTPDGTVLVRDFPRTIPPGRPQAGVERLVLSGGRLFFTVDYTLWTSDGTAVGTRSLGAVPEVYVPVTPFGGRVFFGNAGSGEPPSVMRADGTEGGTTVIADVGVENGRIRAAGGRLFFVYHPRATGSTAFDTLYASDGSRDGTFVVKSFDGMGLSFSIGAMAAVGNELFFLAARRDPPESNAPGALELWRSNGTASGTMRVKDLGRVTTVGAPHGALFATSQRAFFSLVRSTSAGTYSYDLWTSDGSSAGTHRVKTLLNGVVGTNGVLAPAGLAIGDRLFLRFSGLWVTDGTAFGTRAIGEASAMDAVDGPSMENAGGTLFFMSGLNRRPQLWISDGTTTGTRVVRSFE